MIRLYCEYEFTFTNADRRRCGKGCIPVRKKVCVITGANAGIGKQAAIQMARAGYTVVMGCRSRERGEAALADIQQQSGSGDVALLLVDVSLMESVRQFAEEVLRRFPVIDVLIHNAAIFDVSQKQAVWTAEGHETVWMTNHINPVYLTDLLLSALAQSENGRILTVASKGLLAVPGLKVDLRDPEFTKRKFSMAKAYYQSKRAQIMFTLYLAEKLENTNITVNCIRVPAVRVGIARHPNLSGFTKWVYKQKSKQALSPEAMAAVYTYLATSDDVKTLTGRYFDENCQQVQPNAYTRKKENIRAVVSLTYQYLNRRKADEPKEEPALAQGNVL